jgi:tetratricopeptide (TPR) repeat protein
MDSQAALKVISPGKVGRARRTPSQLWQVPIFLAGAICFSLVAATTPLRRDRPEQDFLYDLDTLRALLVKKQGQPENQVRLAQSLLDRLEMAPRRAGEVHYLIGWLYLRVAHAGPPDKADAWRQKAITYLQSACGMVVPEDDQPFLQFRLGQALVESRKDLERAIACLTQSVERVLDQRSLGYGLLATAYLLLPNPNVDAALDANQKQLEYTEDPKQLPALRLTRGELLVRKGRWHHALTVLDHIGAKTPDEVRLRARLLQAECCEHEGLWNRAAVLWQELAAAPEKVPGGKARVLYALGVSHQRSDPPVIRDAETAWREAAELDGDDAQAAGLQLAGLHLGALPDPDRALAELTRALARVNSSKEYHNQRLGLDSARSLFESGFKLLQANKDFVRAARLAELYKRIAEPGKADAQLGRMLEAEGHALTQKADSLANKEKKKLLDKAQRQFVAAGEAFARAAEARPKDQQAETLWRSATCFMAGKEYRRVTTSLERFLERQHDDESQAEACLMLAEALHAVGQKAESRRAFLKCLEYPNTPFAYRALYRLARGAIEDDNLKEAEEILKQNLRVMGPNVDREAHCKSLYLLADLLVRRNDYDQACLYLKEAFKQYPSDPKAYHARDQLGLCYTKLAEEVDKKLRGDLTPEARAYLTGSRNAWLEKAAHVYRELAADLQRSPDLSPENRELLARANLRVADLHFEMNDFSEALRRYQIIQDRNRGRRDGLIACERIWRWASVLSALPEYRTEAIAAARAAVQKAQADLAKMPPDHEAFQVPGRPNREYWVNWLQQVKNRLDQIAAPAGSKR